MNEKPGFFVRIVHFFYAIGLPPMRILQGLIFLVVAGLILAALFVFDTDELFKTADKPDPNQGETTEVVAAPVSQFGSSIDEEIDDIYYFRVNENENYVVAIGKIEQQREKIEELLKRTDLNADQKQKLQYTMLQHSQDALRRNLRAKIDSEIQFEEFTKFANSFVGGEDKKLEDFAKFGLASTGILLLQNDPSEENAERLAETFRKTKSAFVADEKRANKLVSELLRVRQLHPEKPHVDATIDEFGALLGESTDKSISELSTQIAEFSKFSTYDISTLENRIRFKAEDALQDLDSALRVLADNPETDIYKWKLLIRAYEPSLSNGQPAVFETGWKIASELVGKLPDEDAKKASLTAVLESQLQRSETLGSPVDLAGDTLTGRPIDLNDKQAQLLIFCDRTRKSGQLLREFRTRQSEGVQLRRPIVAFKDDYTENDLKQADYTPRGIQLASHETAQQLIKGLSIDFYPYVVLIDSQGNVAALDLTATQAANRMQKTEGN